MKTQTDSLQFTFVVDWSYSMKGDKIKLAKEAIEIYIRSLPPRCEFNILCFGSDHKFMMPKYRTYCDRSVEEALKRIDEIDANMGFTFLYSWLKVLFSSSRKNKFMKNHVILLTDGWVSDARFWYKLIQENSDNFTLNILGLGSGVSTDLVVNYAKAGGGKYYLIEDSCSTLKQDVINCLSSLFEPKIMILDSSIRTIGKKLYEYPELEEIECRMAHGSYFTYYRIIDARGKPLRGSIWFEVQEQKNNGKINEVFLNIQNEAKKIEGDFIFKMFCDQYIREKDKLDLVKDQIVDMSLKFQIASEFTSMIIVDSKNLVKKYKKVIEEEEKINNFDFPSVPKIPDSVDNEKLLIDVMTESRGIIRILCSVNDTVEDLFNKISWKLGFNPECLRVLLRGKPLQSNGTTLGEAGFTPHTVVLLIPRFFGGGFPLCVKSSSEIEWDRLIGMQSYDGSWGSAIKRFGNFHLEHAIKKLPREVRDLLAEDKLESILYTWLALKIIDEYFSDQKDELELVIRKGKDYIFVITNGHLDYEDINESIHFM